LAIGSQFRKVGPVRSSIAGPVARLIAPAALSFVAASASAWCALGCAMLNQTGVDGGAEGGSSPAASDGGTAAATAQGGDCIIEPSTGATICTLISLCPNVPVDHDVYPNCGFRIHGQALDVECACSGALCPLGSPTTCDQVKALLADQTEQQVCVQLQEGRCIAATIDAGASSASGCDRTCASECAGDVTCVRFCGC
jgi:hypothetical protein